jgi:DNA (cytosine-5)-methyltransferase 1
MNNYNFLGLFTGAGGLDLGFENLGFNHIESNEILPYAVATLKKNRPLWDIIEGDVRGYTPHYKGDIDVLLAGFPCQGFSLGGKRDPKDIRNTLYKEVLRIASINQPRVIVLENVLNMRTMIHPETGKPFEQQIKEELAAIGYSTVSDFFKVCYHGVPQTRRRFIFVAFRNDVPSYFSMPKLEPITTARNVVWELGKNDNLLLPNHNPTWGFKSYAHKETYEAYNDDAVIPVRFSRTASVGNPIRSLDEPFPAIDTATVWGWAKGNVTAKRIVKDRTNDKYVRNPDSTAKLWRISASRLRAFTAREYARLQTFPDDWEFVGKSKREIQLQIGNAVPVIFAEKLAACILDALLIMDKKKRHHHKKGAQLKIF